MDGALNATAEPGKPRRELDSNAENGGKWKRNAEETTQREGFSDQPGTSDPDRNVSEMLSKKGFLIPSCSQLGESGFPGHEYKKR